MIPENVKKGKGFFRKNLFAVFFTSISVFIVVFLIIANLRLVNKRNSYTEKINDLRSQIADVERKGKELEKGVSQVQNQAHIEEIAREQLGLKAEGEEVVVISKEEEEKTEEDLSLEQEKDSSWNLSSWWNWVFGE